MAEPAERGDRIRPPLQERSRNAWERVLEAGTWILEHQGRESLTIAAVCARAGVAPTVIYRRVDGLAGLFWAIYDREMAEVAATYRAGLEAASALPAGTDVRTDAVVRAACDTFEQNVAFLHPIINHAATDAALRERGSRESLEFVDRVADLLPSPDGSASTDVARMLHQECVFRAMYGDLWLSHEAETYEAFVSRLSRMAEHRLRP